MRAFALAAGIAALAMVHQMVFGCDLPADGTVLTSRDGTIRLSFRPDPAPLAIDRHFSLIVDVCASATLTGLAVDAQMPAHRHGMNYKPVMSQTAPQRWRADGLLLHMAGRWEFRFDARAGERTERLVSAVDVE
jgi:hypothetical protein